MKFKQIKIKFLRFIHKKNQISQKDRLIKSLIHKSITSHKTEIIYSPLKSDLIIVADNGTHILFSKGNIKIMDSSKNFLEYQPHYKFYNGIITYIENHLNNVSKQIETDVENIENEFIKQIINELN